MFTTVLAGVTKVCRPVRRVLWCQFQACRQATIPSAPEMPDAPPLRGAVLGGLPAV